VLGIEDVDAGCEEIGEVGSACEGGPSAIAGSGDVVGRNDREGSYSRKLTRKRSCRIVYTAGDGAR